MQIKTIKKYLKRIYFILRWYKIKLNILAFRLKYKNIIFFISVPRHGNLGDQAIILAQYKLFNSVGKENIFEIYTNDYDIYSKKLQSIILNTDWIVINGGGNIGTLWFDVEKQIRDIIIRFKNNKIIIFPETAYFSNDLMGRKELEKSIYIYNSHKNLTVFLRDLKSYQLFSKNFNVTKCYFVPDIVLYLKPDYLFNRYREGVLLCFRSDCEKILSDFEIYKIENIIKRKYKKYKFTNTVINFNYINQFNRKKLLIAKLNEFASAKLVITDRLHGMIFAAITGTPCIAFDNISNKVYGIYKWVDYLNYIIYSKNYHEIVKNIDLLYSLDNQIYDNSSLEKYFNLIKDEVRN